MKKIKGKDLYSLSEVYEITYKAFLTVRELIHARKKNILPKQLNQRVMLAVTEVNDCAFCSYGHTKLSLEAGMSNEEIEYMLSGVQSGVPKEELPAIMFAQHYADFRGKPTKQAWEQIVEVYGKERAEGILGAIRIIMAGNVYGIAYGSLVHRFKGNPDTRSNLLYELAIVLASITFVPVALAHAILANFVDTEIISFK